MFKNKRINECMHWKMPYKRTQKVWFFLYTAYWFTFCRISKNRPTLALSALVSSSSSCGSGTRSWLVGRWGSDGRTAPSAAVWWWTHSSWIRLPAQPAAVWNTACVSFWSGCALGTREQLEERGGEKDSMKDQSGENHGHLPGWSACVCVCVLDLSNAQRNEKIVSGTYEKHI